MEGNNLLQNCPNEPGQNAEFDSVVSPFLDVAATAKFLNISTDAVYSLSSRGTLDLCKCCVGRRRFFLRNCLLDQLASGKLDGTKRSSKAQRPSRSEITKCLLKYMRQLQKDPDFTKRYGLLLTIELGAAMLNVEISSLYEWSSRRLIDSCRRKLGRRIEIFRDCLLALIARHGLDTSIRSRDPRGEIDPSLPHETELV